MEPLLFSVFIILFWIPSVLFLIGGLLSYKFKRVRKILLILSLIASMIPLILLLFNGLAEKIKAINMTGTYSGKDKDSNIVIVEIMDNKKFSINVNNCKEASRTGWWEYSSDYDAFLFNADTNQISISYNYQDKLILRTDITSPCCKLTEVQLDKK